MDLQDLKWDKAHGFQKEGGFVIDEVVGELKVTVVECHNNRHPAPKQRIVMLTPDGKARCHCFAFIGRAHGRQVIHDKWTLVKSTGARLISLLERILDTFSFKKAKQVRRLLDKF